MKTFSELIADGTITDAASNYLAIKMQLAAVPPEVFPFQTTVIKYKDGNKQYFKLT